MGNGYVRLKTSVRASGDSSVDLDLFKFCIDSIVVGILLISALLYDLYDVLMSPCGSVDFQVSACLCMSLTCYFCKYVQHLSWLGLFFLFLLNFFLHDFKSDFQETKDIFYVQS